MVVEQLVDEIDDARLGLYLLRGRFGIQGRERLGLAALESNVDFGSAFFWQLDECCIFNNASKQSLAFAVRHARITPESLEVRGHGVWNE